MNENEKDRIAAAVNALRPDWPLKSIRTVLDGPNLTNRPRRDVAVALAWVACESQSKTPARVNEAGPWWTATNGSGENVTNRPPKRSEACATCGRREDEHHGAWLSDHSFTPLERGSAGRTTAPDDLRAELAQATAGLCTHHVDRRRVRCADCDKTATSAKEAL